VKSYYWKTGAPAGQWVLVNTATLTNTPWVLVLYEGDNSAANKGPKASYSVTFSNLLVSGSASDPSVTAAVIDASAVDAPIGQDAPIADAGISSPVSSVVGVTCETTPRGDFATIATPKAVYLVQGIPMAVPTPFSSTTMISRSANDELDLSTCTATSGVTVPVAEYGVGVATVANSVYLIGGNTTGVTTTQSAAYRADIANGNLSSFRVATLAGDAGAPIALQISSYGHAVIQTQDYVYVIGGWSSVGQANVARIERAQVDSVTGDFVTNFEPAIDPTTNSPAMMALPRFDTAAVRLGSWVYVFGGQTDNAPTSQCHTEIQRAGLDSNGNLSSFSQVGTLPNALCAPAIYVAADKLYLIGGATSFIVETNNSPVTATDAVLQAANGGRRKLGRLHRIFRETCLSSGLRRFSCAW
jgi:hypothetical protein